VSRQPPRIRLAAALLLALAGVSACGSLANSPISGIEPGPGAPVGAGIRTAWRRALYALDLLSWKPRDAGCATLTPDARTLLAPLRIGGLYALDAGSGDTIWQVEEPERIVGSAVISGDEVFFASVAGRVHRVSGRTGKPLWSHPVEVRGAVFAPVAVGAGRVFASTELGRVAAIDTAKGAIAWEKERPLPTDFMVQGDPGPLVAGSTVFAGFADGTLLAMAADDGTTLWSASLAGNASRFRDIVGTPVLSGKTLYASCYVTGLHALDVESGRARWIHPGDGLTPPAVEGDALYVATATGEIQAIQASDGRTLWRAKPPGSNPSMPLVAGDLLLVATGTDLVALERKTGRVRARAGTDHGFSARPAWDGRRAYVVSNGGVFHALDID